MIRKAAFLPDVEFNSDDEASSGVASGDDSSTGADESWKWVTITLFKDKSKHGCLESRVFSNKWGMIPLIWYMIIYHTVAVSSFSKVEWKVKQITS